MATDIYIYTSIGSKAYVLYSNCLIGVPKDSFGKQNTKSTNAGIIIPTGRDNDPNGIIFHPIKYGGIISPLD